MTSSEKVAYLKGLMEGMKLDDSTDTGKLLKVIADILGDMAEDVEDVESDLYDLSEEVDAISDELGDLEEYLGVEDDEDEDELDWDDEDEEDDEDDDAEPVFYEGNCPACKKTITVDEDVLALGSIQCPNCGEMMEFESEDAEADEDGEPED